MYCISQNSDFLTEKIQENSRKTSVLEIKFKLCEETQKLLYIRCCSSKWPPYILRPFQSYRRPGRQWLQLWCHSTSDDRQATRATVGRPKLSVHNAHVLWLLHKCSWCHIIFTEFIVMIFRCKIWIRNMKREWVSPHVEYVKMSSEKRRNYTSTNSLLLCEDHFDASQFMCAADKGNLQISVQVSECVYCLALLPLFLEKLWNWLQWYVSATIYNNVILDM